MAMELPGILQVKEMPRGFDVIITFQTYPVVNITGWTLQCKMAKNLGDAALFTKTTGAGTIVITSGTGGTAEITIVAADTSGLTPGDYFMDVIRTDNAANELLAFVRINLYRVVDR